MTSSANISPPCSTNSGSASTSRPCRPRPAVEAAMIAGQDYDEIARRYEAGRASVAVATLIADLETPVSAFLKLAAGRAGNLFLLESVEGGAQRGRYSLIGLDPDVIWRANGDSCEINRRALWDRDAFAPCPGKPLEALRALLAESRIDLPPGLPPMAAGVLGYLGYDMVRQMERLAPAKPDPIGVPEATLIRPTIMVVFDSVRDEISVVTPIRPLAGVGAQARLCSAQRRGRAPRCDHRRPLEGPLRACRARGRSYADRAELKRRRTRTRGGIPRHGREGEGLYRRRRYFSGRAVAALYVALRPAGLFALPRSSPDQSFAVPLLPRFRRLPGRRIEPARKSWSGCAGGGGCDPADRRHALARQDGARRTKRSPPNFWPIRRSALSI